MVVEGVGIRGEVPLVVAMGEVADQEVPETFLHRHYRLPHVRVTLN